MFSVEKLINHIKEKYKEDAELIMENIDMPELAKISIETKNKIDALINSILENKEE